jgi:methyl-accepting chemotaxis protein
MHMFRNLPVARKFFLAFGLVCALCALLGITALTGMSRINESTTNLAKVALPSSHILAEMDAAMQVYRRADMGILLCDTGDCVDYYKKTRNRTSASFDSAATEYSATGTDPKERALFEPMRKDFTDYRAASDGTILLLGGDQKTLASEQTVGANALIFRRADAEMNRVLEVNTQSSVQRCLHAASTFKLVRLCALIMIALTVLLSGGIGCLLTRAIAPPLLRATQVLEGMAAKDLTQTMVVESQDEIGRMATALNTGIGTVRGLLNSMDKGVETISAAAAQLSTCAPSKAPATCTPNAARPARSPRLHRRWQRQLARSRGTLSWRT